MSLYFEVFPQSRDTACRVLTGEASQKNNSQLSIQVEDLTPDERFNELVFTALRTKIGVDLKDLRLRFGDTRCNQLLRQAQKYIDAGNMQIINNRLSLTHSGIYISDSIISDFMIV